jgi:hypothetical protein
MKSKPVTWEVAARWAELVAVFYSREHRDPSSRESAVLLIQAQALADTAAIVADAAERHRRSLFNAIAEAVRGLSAAEHIATTSPKEAAELRALVNSLLQEAHAAGYVALPDQFKPRHLQ